MDAEKMRNVLQSEYGIKNKDEFYAAEAKATPIMIGLFTTPLPERKMTKCEGKQ